MTVMLVVMVVLVDREMAGIIIKTSLGVVLIPSSFLGLERNCWVGTREWCLCRQIKIVPAWRCGWKENNRISGAIMELWAAPESRCLEAIVTRAFVFISHIPAFAMKIHISLNTPMTWELSAAKCFTIRYIKAENCNEHIQ